jgi:hypothetical protein
MVVPPPQPRVDGGQARGYGLPTKEEEERWRPKERRTSGTGRKWHIEWRTKDVGRSLWAHKKVGWFYMDLVVAFC